MLVLKMLVSWERALPLTDVSWLIRHNDPAVRQEAMHLLRYLPATSQNQATVRAGLFDPNEDVKEAAAAAIRLGPPKLELTARAASGGLELVRAATAHRPAARLAVSAGPCLKAPAGAAHAIFGMLAEPFAKWRISDVEN